MKRTREARNASSLVAYHVKSGNIIKPEACQQCGEKRFLEAAHADYSKPLDVRWLCISCHRRWDHADPKISVGRRLGAQDELKDEALHGRQTAVRTE